MKDNHAQRWKGFVAGSMGSLVGLMAMGFYQQQIAPAVKEMAGGGSRQGSGGQSGSQGNGQSRGQGQSEPLDDISLVGRHYEKDESATAALGRIAYKEISGQEPQSEETEEMLSYLVHWGYGIFQGGMYGALRASADGLDVKGGLGYATALWLFGDELAVPMLGLQGGPTSVSEVQHLNRLGAHLAYGLGTAIATQTLLKVL